MRLDSGPEGAGCFGDVRRCCWVEGGNESRLWWWWTDGRLQEVLATLLAESNVQSLGSGIEDEIDLPDKAVPVINMAQLILDGGDANFHGNSFPGSWVGRVGS